MQLELKKYLYDMREAATLAATFAAGRTFNEYESDAMLRSAVERQFEIIGEALVWAIVESRLPVLRREVDVLLAEPES